MLTYIQAYKDLGRYLDIEDLVDADLSVPPTPAMWSKALQLLLLLEAEDCPAPWVVPSERACLE